MKVLKTSIIFSLYFHCEDINLAPDCRLFQKNAHMFHRMFEIAARLMIFHVKHVCIFQLNRGKIRDLDPAIS